ncbi:MAG: hypothetical protein M3N54_12670 [Acidobacteriota bacterium]|nr:hypothetical protein [Acidobacteriota bacterium]
MSISERTAAIVGGSALVIHGALKRGPAGAIAIGIGGVIAYLGLRPTTEAVLTGRQVMRSSYTMDLDPYEAFVKWQDLSALPSVMRGIGSFKKMDNGNSRFALPGGVGNIEVKTSHEQPGHVIEFRTVDGAKIDGHCIVRFTRKKNGKGTKVHLELSYGPAGANAKSQAEQPTLQPVG